jgi:hypothetical protein
MAQRKIQPPSWLLSPLRCAVSMLIIVACQGFVFSPISALRLLLLDSNALLSVTSTTTIANAVWVKLVIDGGDDSYEAFELYQQIPKNVGRLKDAIMEKAKHLFNADIHSLNVYPAGTKVPVPEGVAKPLRPDLELSNLGVLGEVTYQKPLIVTAKSRHQPQQQQATAVRLYRALAYSVFRLFPFKKQFSSHCLYTGCGSTAAAPGMSRYFHFHYSYFDQIGSRNNNNRSSDNNRSSNNNNNNNNYRSNNNKSTIVRNMKRIVRNIMRKRIG